MSGTVTLGKGVATVRAIAVLRYRRPDPGLRALTGFAVARLWRVDDHETETFRDFGLNVCP